MLPLQSQEAASPAAGLLEELNYYQINFSSIFFIINSNLLAKVLKPEVLASEIKFSRSKQARNFKKLSVIFFDSLG